MKHKNRLAAENSPYLLQHSENPVDWFPWCEEAFTAAAKEDKPILLSIGYSACHWCHVMEKESFENPDIAAIMNKFFINIKVDREERPDIDNIYMSFVTATAGRGGWPMTVFLFPNKTPFYGGTYFPPEDRNGMPGFPKLLNAIYEAYKTRKDTIKEQVSGIIRTLSRHELKQGAEELNNSLILNSIDQLKDQFDTLNGGFGSAPKFPMSMALNFLADEYCFNSTADSLNMLETTVKKMSLGGMYDHIGGGYHRYSTDEIWLVPHFEKMLYDNALLVVVLTKLYRITSNKFYLEKATETLDFVLNEMTSPEGGFYSTIDADSPDGEGYFYTWTLAELEGILTPEEYELIASYFNITGKGNFEHRNILFAECGLDEFISGMKEKKSYLFNSAKRKMYLKRSQRIRPALDDKILTDWNGLMLSAFCAGYKVTGDKKYYDTAVKSADFLLNNLLIDNKLFHSYKDGKTKINAFLEDYANLISALIDTYEITFNAYYLKKANELAAKAVEHFYDSEKKLFYQTSSADTEILYRPTDIYDNATPSGNSTMTNALFKLGRIFGNESFVEISRGILAKLSGTFRLYPLGFGRYLSAVLSFIHPYSDFIITGPEQFKNTDDWKLKLYKELMPNTILIFNDKNTIDLNPERVNGKDPIDNKLTLYRCENFACLQPEILE